MVFSSLEVQRKLIYTKAFLLCLKRNDSKTFKRIANAKNHSHMKQKDSLETRVNNSEERLVN